MLIALLIYFELIVSAKPSVRRPAILCWNAGKRSPLRRRALSQRATKKSDCILHEHTRRPPLLVGRAVLFQQWHVPMIGVNNVGTVQVI